MCLKCSSCTQASGGCCQMSDKKSWTGFHTWPWDRRLSHSFSNDGNGKQFTCTLKFLKEKKNRSEDTDWQEPLTRCGLCSLFQKATRANSPAWSCLPLTEQVTTCLRILWLLSGNTIFLLLSPKASTMSQWTKQRTGSLHWCQFYSKLVAQCDPGQGPQRCGSFSAENYDSTLWVGCRN